MSQRYSEKADVYSFGMVMWECLSRRIPFDGMSALAAAMNVATLGLRPEMPPGTDPLHAELIRECWAPVPDQVTSNIRIHTVVCLFEGGEDGWDANGSDVGPKDHF